MDKFTSQSIVDSTNTIIPSNRSKLRRILYQQSLQEKQLKDILHNSNQVTKSIDNRLKVIMNKGSTTADEFEQILRKKVHLSGPKSRNPDRSTTSKNNSQAKIQLPKINQIYATANNLSRLSKQKKKHQHNMSAFVTPKYHDQQNDSSYNLEITSKSPEDINDTSRLS